MLTPLKKIYYIANVRMPTERAHGLQLAKMCEAFTEKGIEVVLIVPRKKNNIEKNPKDFYGLRKPLKVISLWNINIFPKSSIGFNINSFSFALSYFFYLFFMKKEKGSAIYTIDLDQFSFFLAPFLGLPIFFEVHGSKKKNMFNSFFFKRVSRFIAVSSKIREKLIEVFDLPPEKVIVKPNGIDFSLFEKIPAKFEARREINLPENRTILLYIGKFYDWKGLDIFLDVALNFQSTFFYFVGGTEAELLAATGKKVLPQNVFAPGYKSHKEIPLWLSAADYLIISGTKKNQYSYEETSPMKLFEYMASKRPIIAARTPAIETIGGDSEFIFYEPDDAEDLEKTLLAVLPRKNAADDRIANSYKKALELSWERRAEAIIDFVNKKL